MAPLDEVAAWAAHLPPESAVARDVDEWGGRRSDELEFLRAIEHGVRVVAWVGAHGKRHDYPKPIRFPWDARDEAVWRGDALDWDKAVEALGNDERFAAVMARLTK